MALMAPAIVGRFCGCTPYATAFSVHIRRCTRVVVWSGESTFADGRSIGRVIRDGRHADGRRAASPSPDHPDGGDDRRLVIGHLLERFQVPELIKQRLHIGKRQPRDLFQDPPLFQDASQRHLST